MMKKRISSRYRSLLARGGAVFAILFLLFCETGCHNSKDTETIVIQPMTMTEVSATCTTMFTTTTSTTSSTSTKTTTTTTVETTSTSIPSTAVESTTATTMNVNTTLAQIETQPYVVATQPVVVEQQPVEESGGLPITETERIMLCNIVAREYGSDWVSVYDKACVVATVMNRVNSASFPNTIYDVLVQPNQFTGYIPQDTYTYQVTDSCIEAVNYYFNHQGEFGNYLYFWGDGTRNYFS